MILCFKEIMERFSTSVSASSLRIQRVTLMRLRDSFRKVIMLRVILLLCYLSWRIDFFSFPIAWSFEIRRRNFSFDFHLSKVSLCSNLIIFVADNMLENLFGNALSRLSSASILIGLNMLNHNTLRVSLFYINFF